MIIDKTHNKFVVHLVHELKMRFKLLNFARKLFLDTPKKTPPCSRKFIFTKKFCLFYIINTQTIYIYKKIDVMNGFVKLRAVSKLSTLIVYTL